MEIYVMTSSYDCYGGHTTLSPIGSFLLSGAESFGSGVTEINLTLNFASSGRPTKGLEELWKMHHDKLSKLPKVTFRRTKGAVDIEVASKLLDGKDREYSPRLSLPLFVAGFDEVIDALSLMRKRVKSGDAFDLDAFLSHCETARQRIPGSQDALQALAVKLRAADEARRAAMSPWEQLDIDWNDFHPEARKILNDPFFWSPDNDFSPNGNDTGFDLLQDYRKWLKKHKGQPTRFIERLVKQWGYMTIDAMDEEIRDKAIIGLAFADIKLRGVCDEQIHALALESVDRQRAQAKASIGWTHRDECLRTTKKIKSKLLRVEVQSQGSFPET